MEFVQTAMSKENPHMSTDLVPTNTDLAEVTGLEKAKEIIRRSSDPTEIADIHAIAHAAAVYADAQGAREHYLQAAEVKLLAERKAGSLRLSFPREYKTSFDRAEARRLRESGLSYKAVGEQLGVTATSIRQAALQGWPEPTRDPINSPIADFDEKFNVSRALLLNWQKLSKIPDPDFASLLEEAKEHDLAMTGSSFLRRYGQSYETRVEPCIYRGNLDGRLILKWQRDKVSRSKVLETTDLDVARKELAKVQGRINTTTVPANARTLGDAYSLVRRALQTLDVLNPRLDPASRRATEKAIAHLHKAEDEIVKASNSIPAGKPGRPKTRS